MMDIQGILSSIEYTHFEGNIDSTIQNIVGIDDALNSANVLTWCNDGNINKITALQNCTIICSILYKSIEYHNSVNFIVVENPRRAFLSAIKLYAPATKAFGISARATISSTVKIDEQVNIGSGVVIEDNCIIGKNVRISHNTVIYENTIIKDNVIIGANCTIGGTGFGYEKNEENVFELLPHIGNVVICENVEIGNNTCIDRAVLGSTTIKENCKIDNLVHIAHGCKIGKNTIIIANSLIGGSTIIDENVWVAPSATVLNKLHIEKNSVIGTGAVVINSVLENQVVVGNPAKVLVKK
jgi:UDP-3-O-[3-hydroxymyristoyl] glucosamine N-acyltransferase